MRRAAYRTPPPLLTLLPTPFLEHSYIANPDLVERFAKGASLNPYDRDTFYASGAKGYNDYPVLGSAVREGQFL